VPNTTDSWRCTIQNPPLRVHYTPTRMGGAADSNGEVECMSSDGRNCKWYLHLEDCIARVAAPVSPLQPLQCGLVHQTLYGNSGYENPGHWCMQALIDRTQSARDDVLLSASVVVPQQVQLAPIGAPLTFPQVDIDSCISSRPASLSHQSVSTPNASFFSMHTPVPGRPFSGISAIGRPFSGISAIGIATPPPDDATPNTPAQTGGSAMSAAPTLRTLNEEIKEDTQEAANQAAECPARHAEAW
jgi:hypothetical protein